MTRKVRPVEHVDDQVKRAFLQDSAGGLLFLSECVERVDTGCVQDLDVAPGDAAGSELDGGARVVGRHHPGTCQSGKECALSAVGLAHKSDEHRATASTGPAGRSSGH